MLLGPSSNVRLTTGRESSTKKRCCTSLAGTEGRTDERHGSSRLPGRRSIRNGSARGAASAPAKRIDHDCMATAALAVENNDAVHRAVAATGIAGRPHAHRGIPMFDAIPQAHASTKKATIPRDGGPPLRAAVRAVLLS